MPAIMHAGGGDALSGTPVDCPSLPAKPHEGLTFLAP
jgi:hypothetical protein